jgi:hypothetical protein
MMSADVDVDEENETTFLIPQVPNYPQNFISSSTLNYGSIDNSSSCHLLQYNKYCRGVKELPSELNYLILEYLTREFQEILKFKSVCRAWKLVAETSPLWLRIHIRVYCPLRYLIAMRVNIPNDQTKIEIIDNRHTLFSKRIILLGEHLDYKKAFRLDIRRDSLYKNRQFKNVFEKAKAVHDSFIKVFVSYNRKWDYFASWKQIEIFPSLKRYEYLMNYIVFPIMTINTILSYLCVYLFEDYSSSGKDLSERVLWGFFCVYLFLSLYMFSYIIGIANKYLNKLLDSDELEIKVSWKTMFPDSFIVTILIGSIFCVSMIQRNVIHLEPCWTCTTIPAWITGFILVFETYVFNRYYLDNTFSASVIFTFLAALAITLVISPFTAIGWAYDHHLSNLKHYWQYLTILIYPIALLLIAFTVLLVVFCIFLYYSYFYENENISLSGSRPTPTNRIMKFIMFWFTTSTIHAIIYNFLLASLLILPWNEEWLSQFPYLKDLPPLSVLFLMIASFHVFIITFIVSAIVEIL